MSNINPKIPNGSWIMSSNNDKAANGFLICECKHLQREYIKIKVKIKDNSNFDNINGKLVKKYLLDPHLSKNDNNMFYKYLDKAQ